MTLGEVADENLVASDESASEGGINIIASSNDKDANRLSNRFELISTSCPGSASSTPPSIEAVDKNFVREIIEGLSERRLTPSMDLFSLGCVYINPLFIFLAVQVRDFNFIFLLEIFKLTLQFTKCL